MVATRTRRAPGRSGSARRTRAGLRAAHTCCGGSSFTQLWLAASVPTHFAHGGEGTAESVLDQVDLNAIASVVRGRDAATHRRHDGTGALSTLLPLSSERMDGAETAEQLTPEQEAELTAVTDELEDTGVTTDQANAIKQCLRFGNKRADIDGGAAGSTIGMATTTRQRFRMTAMRSRWS